MHEGTAMIRIDFDKARIEEQEGSFAIKHVDPSVFEFLSTRKPVREGVTKLLNQLLAVRILGDVALRLRADEDSYYVVIDIKSTQPDEHVLDLVESVTFNLDPTFIEALAGTVVVAEGVRNGA
jgi:hypothetical protein